MQMDMMKISVLAILGALVGLTFRGQKQEYQIAIGMAVTLLIFGCTVAYMLQVKEQLSVLLSYVASKKEYFSLLLKVTGITWLCEFSAGICRDSGFGAAASQIEMFGKIAILFSGMPVFLALAETIAGFVG